MYASIRNNRNLVLVALCLVMSLPLVAQDTAATSEDTLEAVAEAYIGVMEIQNEYGPRIEAASSAEEAQTIQQEAANQMVQVIENQDGVTLDEYQQIMMEAQENESLRERLATMVEQIIEDRAEG